MNNKVVIFVSIFIGIVITFLSSFFVKLITPTGIIFFGFPFNWLSQGSIGPNTNLNQYNIIWINLIFDMVIWSTIPFLILWFYTKSKKK